MLLRFHSLFSVKNNFILSNIVIEDIFSDDWERRMRIFTAVNR